MARAVGQGLREVFAGLRDGRKLRYVIGGDSGPLVLFEAGGGDAAGMWVAVQEELSRECRTIAYDRPGLGGSDPAPGARTLQRMGADLIGLLDSIGVNEPVVFVGHSWGCNVIRAAAEQAPGRVGGLIYIDPTLSAAFEGGYLRGAVAMHMKYLLAVLAGFRRKLLARFHDGRWPELTSEQLEIVLADHWTARSLIATIREMRKVETSAEDVARLEASPGQIPYRYIMGRRGDPALRGLMYHAAAELASMSRCGSIAEVEDAGHCVPQERPHHTTAEISKFLAEFRKEPLE